LVLAKQKAELEEQKENYIFQWEKKASLLISAAAKQDPFSPISRIITDRLHQGSLTRGAQPVHGSWTQQAVPPPVSTFMEAPMDYKITFICTVSSSAACSFHLFTF
jgi:hypothetical protein